MTRIILESKNNNDVRLIKQLAERLHIHYKIQSVRRTDITGNDIEPYYKLIDKIIDVSNYGEPSHWQKNVRKDRRLKLS